MKCPRLPLNEELPSQQSDGFQKLHSETGYWVGGPKTTSFWAESLDLEYGDLVWCKGEPPSLLQKQFTDGLDLNRARVRAKDALNGLDFARAFSTDYNPDDSRESHLVFILDLAADRDLAHANAREIPSDIDPTLFCL